MCKLQSTFPHISWASWKGMWFERKNCILCYLLNMRLPKNTQTVFEKTNEFITHLLYNLINSLFWNVQLKPKQWTHHRQHLKHFTSNPTKDVFTQSVPIHLIFCRCLFWTIFPTYMAHAVAFATIRTAKTREHLRKVLTQRNCKYKVTSNVPAQHRNCLYVPSTIDGVEICLGCRRDRPFFDHTHLVFDEVVPMRREETTRPDSDEDCIRIGVFPCFSHYAERLDRLEQVPIFKVLVPP